MKKMIKRVSIGFFVFLIGLSSPFLSKQIKAIYDTSTCTVFHSGSGNTCTNYTYAYAFEGGGEFRNTFTNWYTGYSNSIKWEKQRWDPTSVTQGDPYYQYAWVSGPDTTTTYYGRDYYNKFLRNISYVDFTMNKTVNLRGQSTLRIHSDYHSVGSTSVNYDVIIYPR